MEITKVNLGNQEPEIYKVDLDNPYENVMCNAILKTGKNKGNACGKYCKLGYFQCNRHFKQGS